VSAAEKSFHLSELSVTSVDFLLEIYFVVGGFGGHLWPVFTKHPI
jgi:hypothetical protein